MKKMMILLVVCLSLGLVGCVGGMGYAIKTKDKALIEKYLSAGQDINDYDSYGRTPLMSAVFYGHLDMVELLIDKGADLDIQSQDGHFFLKKATALQYATYYGWDRIADYLIKKGASLDNQTKKGQTALHMATYYQFTNIAKSLVKAKADTSIKDNNGQTALDYAEKFNFHELVELLKNS